MFNDLFGAKQESDSGERKSWRATAMRRILFVFFLFGLILWGLYSGKFDLRSGTVYIPGQYAAEKKIEVHPAVLNLQESFAQVAETVKPAVVNISTVYIEKDEAGPYDFYYMDPEDLFDQFFNPNPRSRKSPKGGSRQRKVSGTGSGVIIDPDGYILTNEHVVRGADEIKVTLSDNPDKRYDGKVIGRDERTDLAVVKIKTSKKLPYVNLGDSDAIRVGDWSIAIGSPFGLAQTVTVGIISASRQNLRIEDRIYKDLIQTDAAINSGNSGGPLLNIHGEVIGINTAIYTPSGGFAGIGFAIPINRAKEILPQLREKGKVVRSWLGVALDDNIDDATAAVFGVPDKEGAMIGEVFKDYPAAKAGLKRGDIVREFNGKKVKNNYDLQNVVASVPPNSRVTLKIIRNKKTMNIELVTAEAPASMDSLKKKPGETEATEESSDESASWLGATVKNVTGTLRDRFSVPESEKGVFVVEVKRESKAEEIGLESGDLIREINQKLITDIKSFRQATADVKIKEGIVIDVLRKGSSIYLKYIEPD